MRSSGARIRSGMNSRSFKLVPLLVALAMLLQFACCVQMAQPAATSTKVAAKSDHSCCHPQKTAAKQSKGDHPSEPCSSCPIMSGTNVAVDHATPAVDVTPDLASPICFDLVESLTKTTLTITQVTACTSAATSPPPDILVQHCVFQL